MKINVFSVLPIILAGLLLSCSTTKDMIKHENVDPIYLEVNKIAQELTAAHNVPGVAVALIKNGDISWIQSIGYADVASKKRVTPHIIFNVGSVSKVVSAWGFMQLIEKGELSLDSPVDNALSGCHLPESPFDKSKVTMKRILSHTAGLSVHKSHRNH